MKYLVVGSRGPGFDSPDSMVPILKGVILPSFDMLMKWEKEGKILAGGLPVGERAFVFIAEAASNDDLDRLLRTLPMWGALDWEVSALQSFAGRAQQEREISGI
jgi:hypothetical protein